MAVALRTLLSGLDPAYLNVDVDLALSTWTRAWTLHVVADREASLVDAYLAVERAETMAIAWRRDIVERVTAMLDSSLSLALDVESIARRYVRALERLVGADDRTLERARDVDAEFEQLVRALERRALNTYVPRLELLGALRAAREPARASMNVHQAHVRLMYAVETGAAVRHSTELGRMHALTSYRHALEHAQHELAFAYARLEGAVLASSSTGGSKQKRVL